MTTTSTCNTNIKKIMIVVVCLIVTAVAGLVFGYVSLARGKTSAAPSRTNPLAGRTFYIDSTRPITQLARQYEQAGDKANAALASKISSHPGSVWLTGPTETDPMGNKDIVTVLRTSHEAAAAGTVPVYVIYAIPNRDACAGFSSGGFNSAEEYSAWLHTVETALSTKAVFIIEPDAVPHAIQDDCFSVPQRTARYSLLNTTIKKLHADRHTLAVYIDAGNADWIKDTARLVEPLKAAGVGDADGIAANTASYVSTSSSVAWAQQLVKQLGIEKGTVIDTSRNGRGEPPPDLKGTGRWCNPPGRGLGHVPTTTIGQPAIDAYVWVKNIGESDGSCFGNPPAGTFVPTTALELARNAEF